MSIGKPNYLIKLVVIALVIFAALSSYKQVTEFRNIPPTRPENIALCSDNNSYASFLPFNQSFQTLFSSEPIHPRFLDPTVMSTFPRVQPNDNTIAAGTLAGKRLDINLEVMWSDYFFEGSARPGLRVVALAERGKKPTIPAPLIRVKTGTIINVSILNTLSDSTLTVYGLQKRPAEMLDSVFILPGEKKSIRFEGGEPGTYFYYVKLGKGMPYDLGEEEQLAGGFIIDPVEGSPPDRVFVINFFSAIIDKKIHPHGWLEAYAINGTSWPNTERIKLPVGNKVRWRIINTAQQAHPMHLHGFYYDVLSKGEMLRDNVYTKEDRRTVVTEFMEPRTTFTMEWTPSRPGMWLFHCHLPFHFSPDLRLPYPSPPGTEHEDHMAGLVVGLEVSPGPTDIISKGKPRDLNLYAFEFRPSDGKPKRGFSFSSSVDTSTYSRPGPPIILKQYETTYLTLHNGMTIPTSVHWHGLEIDSWADGVPEYSASEGKVSPTVRKGEKFTYKLSSLRAGTFIYHSHLDDQNQMLEGLYGPLIVMGEGDTFNPARDHIYVYSWKNLDSKSIEDFELNGTYEQPDKNVGVREIHRLRLINISPDNLIGISIEKDGKDIPFRFIAKDGADLSPRQQKIITRSQMYAVGETADFSFKPEERGTYILHIHSDVFPKGWTQRWIVK